MPDAEARPGNNEAIEIGWNSLTIGKITDKDLDFKPGEKVNINISNGRTSGELILFDDLVSYINDDEKMGELLDRIVGKE